MSVHGPTIGNAPFTPRPRAAVAVWGVTVRRFDEQWATIEVIEPEDVEVLGTAPVWYPAYDGSGIRYARVVTTSGLSFAILRAVPLS